METGAPGRECRFIAEVTASAPWRETVAPLDRDRVAPSLVNVRSAADSADVADWNLLTEADGTLKGLWPASRACPRDQAAQVLVTARNMAGNGTSHRHYRSRSAASLSMMAA